MYIFILIYYCIIYIIYYILYIILYIIYVIYYIYILYIVNYMLYIVYYKLYIIYYKLYIIYYKFIYYIYYIYTLYIYTQYIYMFMIIHISCPKYWIPNASEPWLRNCWQDPVLVGPAPTLRFKISRSGSRNRWDIPSLLWWGSSRKITRFCNFFSAFFSIIFLHCQA